MISLGSQASEKSSDRIPPSKSFGEKYLQLKSWSKPETLKTCEILASTQPITHAVKPGDRLSVSFGLDPASLKKFPTGEFEYRILVNGQTDSPLFRRTLNPAEKPEDRGWQDADVSLDRWAGRTVTISFSAKPVSSQESAAVLLKPVWGGLRIGAFKRTSDRCNVIFISLDTLRVDHLGYTGYSRNTSPNIDKMASNAVFFRQAIAQSPWTKPSHMSVFTGLLPSHHGQTLRNDLDHGMMELPPSILTLTEILQRNGYLTQAYTGACYVAARFGFARGFDRYVEMAKTFNDEGPFIFNSASRWIESHRDENFFLFVHTYEIHSPYRHHLFDRPALKDPNAMMVAQYDSGIRYADSLVGELLDTLDRLGLSDKTLVVLFSDHGEELFERGYDALHGHTLYDELLRVPLIFYWPGHLAHRDVSDIQAQHVDILPTVLDLAKIKERPSRLDGHSLVPSLRGQPNSEPSVVISEAVEYGALDLRSIRLMDHGIYKFIYSPSVVAGHPEIGNDQDNDYWLDYVIPHGGREFYDLVKDPEEKNDIIDDAPPVRKEMETRLRRYVNGLKPPTISRPAVPVDSTLRDQLRSLGY